MHITHTLSQNNQVREIPSVCFLNLPFECHLLILSQPTPVFFFFYKQFFILLLNRTLP